VANLNGVETKCKIFTQRTWLPASPATTEWNLEFLPFLGPRFTPADN
jgi:hypothetical protein